MKGFIATTLAAAFLLISPSIAGAQVSFGIHIGTPVPYVVPAAPVYPAYPYGYGYYYPGAYWYPGHYYRWHSGYYYPRAYWGGYPRAYWGGPYYANTLYFGGHWGGHRHEGHGQGHRHH